jgi:predicted ATP-grasp superfamily ATP-dependent carboligase
MAEPPGKLAIVGASVRAAAFSALRGGFQVVAADLFADADLQRHCPATRVSDYPQGLAAWLAATDCDGWLYTGALENHPDLVGLMAKSRRLLGNGGGALRAVRNPHLLQPVLSAAGLSFPETLDACERLPRDGSWLCKTYRGGNGANVWLLDGDAALARAEAQGAYFQRLIRGVSASAVFVCGPAGARLMGVTQQLVGDARAGARPWSYSGSIGPLAVSGAVEGQLRQLGDLLSTRFRLRGLAGVDLVIAHDRAWTIEVNPRYSASVEIVERISGVNALAAHVAACLAADEGPLASLGGDEPAPAADRTTGGTLYGKTVLYAKREVVISDEFFQWAIAQSAIDPRSCALADVGAAGQRIAAGHPVLTLLVEASADHYDKRLSERVAEVESRLYNSY